MNQNLQRDVNSLGTMATLLLIGALVMAILLLAPIVVGAYITELGFSVQQAGYLISADMAGIGFATIPALFWLPRFSWHLVFKISLLATIALHIASALTGDFTQLLAIRFFCGLGSGTIVAVCIVCFGLTRHPDRVYALWVAGQLLIGAFGLAVLPHVMPEWGIKVVFFSLAATSGAALLFLKYIPSSIEAAQPITGAKHHAHLGTKSTGKIALGIAGLYLFYVALSGVWAYIERIGVSAELTPEHIGYILAIASILGIAGALTASVLDTRWGRLVPTAFGLVIIVTGLLALSGVNSVNTSAAALFILGAFTFKYAWTFILPYFLASISSQDKSGRAIVIANIFVGAGMASGPAIAAQFITGESYTSLITMGIICMLVCFLLFLPLILSKRDGIKSGSPTQQDHHIKANDH
ncbi:MAG: hypothetical protein DRR42_07345 [Gammaproteobacteria bacterium]|nr:MAG: hypothetical protein DRR42_07345 [Gammaproteobacteria bacterium]